MTIYCFFLCLKFATHFFESGKYAAPTHALIYDKVYYRGHM